MDKRELLKNVVNNIINDKSEQASLDLHNYMTLKMKEVSGIQAPAAEMPEAEQADDAE
jgi:hypothetical protein